MAAREDSTEARQYGGAPSLGVGINDYVAPVDDILLDLEVAGLSDVLALPTYQKVDRDSIELALEEFGRFASNVIAPTNQVGDRDGSKMDPATGAVRTPAGFREMYAEFVESGWSAAQFPSSYGGGGLPSVVSIALQEMLASANVALSLNPVLTQSAIEVLLEWGSEDQRLRYVPRLLTGEWCGAMDITESDAGSDLGAVTSRAKRDNHGTWHIYGTKIFITWGEHDLAKNIIHLVLARTPGAAAGTKGLSLFIVPKRIVNDRGTLERRNNVRCVRLESKLGLHASPTCVMEFDGALGELIGQEGRGTTAMFTMMNAARLSIGLQGPAIAERAFQHAYRYATQRKQGRAIGIMPPERSPLITHPDVRRMLLSMRTCVIAGRLLIYTTSCYRDFARHGASGESRAQAQGYLDLLTPVAKAWSSDMGVLAASTGIQVLGGAGYIEDGGMAQHLRDARIAPIYEGTNGIQAVDLVMRKLPRGQGKWIRALLREVGSTLRDLPPRPHHLTESYASLSDALAVLESVTERLLERMDRDPNDALAGATLYLELLGLTLSGWLMLRRAHLAFEFRPDAKDQVTAESEFFATEFVARASGLGRAILAGAGRLSGL